MFFCNLQSLTILLRHALSCQSTTSATFLSPTLATFLSPTLATFLSPTLAAFSPGRASEIELDPSAESIQP